MVADVFSEREKAFENKFGHDAELNFKAHAQAARLFGLWAAEHLGLTGRAAEAYAEKTMELDVQDPDVGEIVSRVQKDLQAKNIEMSERSLFNQFSAKLEFARRRQFS